MFVLPPPPRYPSQAAYNLALANGQAVPMVETNNVLSHPTGPEYQLVVGEGTYVLKEDLYLATPPPHPSEVSGLNSNPLTTTPQPATAGTKLSLLSFSSKSSGSLLDRVDTNGSQRSARLRDSIHEHPNERRQSEENIPGSSKGRGTSVNSSVRPRPSVSSAPAFGEGNHMLLAAGKDAGKSRKPKNNIAKSNSSFISRCIVHENLARRLQDRPIDGYFAFANINRAFQWLDLSSAQKALSGGRLIRQADYMTKILFTKGHCLCHDVNQVTKTQSHIDLIMGFSTGEIIWYEPLSQKYTRLNKNGIINSTPVADIKWIPGSENLFLVGHMDGSLVVYDKEKDDAAFLPQGNATTATKAHAEASDGSRKLPATLQVHKSVHSKNQRFNPVSIWKLSKQQITSFAFSPDNRHLAVVSEGGALRIIDYLKERLLDIYYSYYGDFLCVCWSPDGKYVVTGGQDDLVTIWSVVESRIVARCQGHHSYVTGVCFDPWRCDDRNYRFGSVGEDCRLLLWDFSVGMLHRPKAASGRNRGSICSRLPNLCYAETPNTTVSWIRSDSTRSTLDNEAHTVVHQAIEHPVESRATTAILPPVLSKKVDPHPLCWLKFIEDGILTSCQSGHIRTWGRPQEVLKGENDTSVGK